MTAEVEGDWSALATLVKAQRRRLGIPTQGDAADRAGFSRNTWQRLENSKPISASSLVGVATVLGWHPSYPMAVLEHGLDAAERPVELPDEPTAEASETIAFTVDEQKLTLTFRCSCGGGMFPSALVSIERTGSTMRMACGGCCHTVDVTYQAA